jgi:hypothetical protein
MNREKGYLEVNNIFKSFFSEIKNEYLCGRCFSGDEILIATSDIEGKHGIKIREFANKYGLDFRYVKVIYNDGDIKEIINELTTKLNGRF